MPGYINELWFLAEKPGVYRGQCAELCGRDHGFMPIVVEVKSRQEFDARLASQQAAMQASNAPAAKIAQAAPNTVEQTALRVANAE